MALEGADETLELTFRIDRNRLARAQALDDRYVPATNAAHLDVDTALTLFEGQDGVEKCFQSAKWPSQVRPLLVHSDRHLEGLMAITLLAPLSGALLERACRQRGLILTMERL